MAEELLIVTPDHQSRRVVVDDKDVSLGRAHTNDLCYAEDASLSRNHMMLRRKPDGIYVEDMGSKNGTLLNGARLTQPQRLSPGDRIVAGHLEITLVDPDNDSPVVFVGNEAGADIEPQGTVITRLADLMSNEQTEPLLRPGAIPGGPAPATPAGAGPKPFDSPLVRAMLRAGRELASNRPLAEMFSLILDMSIEAVGAERGVLLVLEGGKLVSKAWHGDQFRISATVRDKVINERASLLVRDMAQEEAFRERQSISAQQIHTMMAVPLQTEDRVIGLIYVDSRLWMREFQADDLNLLTFLGNVAAIRIEQERLALLERENQQAAEIQRRILPRSAPIIAGLDLAGFNQPCHTVGGDYYDFIPYPDGRIAVVLADVAGKGISAALLVSNLQARVQILAENPGKLDDLVERLDKSLAKQCPNNRFITMFFSMIDSSNGSMEFVNAGHNPPLVVRECGTVDRLEAAGTVLGILPELGYTVHDTVLQTGDVMAIFSDGVTESVGTNGEEFGEDRLADLLRARRELPAETIVEQVLTELRVFTGDAPAEDDITLVVVRRPA